MYNFARINSNPTEPEDYAMRPLILLSLFIGCAAAAQAQRCDVDSGFRGSNGEWSIPFKYMKFVHVFHSRDDIAAAENSALDEYLKRKLGESFAKRLIFDEGEWLDLTELRKKSASIYKQNVNHGNYYLHFYFSDPDKGLKAYYTTMVLNEDGSVWRSIDLPDIGSNPSKGVLISCRDAYAIAARSGFPENVSSARFEYWLEGGSFVWIITNSRPTTPDDLLAYVPGGGTYKKIAINANSGTVVKIYKETIFF